MSGVSLITGSSGFVGRELLRQLSAELSASAAHTTLRLLQRPAHDLLQPQSLQAICSGVDTIYHLAAYAHVNQAQTRQLYAINVDGTRHLLQAAIDAGVSHLVYVSSILADPAFDRPRTAYGDSKWQAEQLLMAAHQQQKIRVSIIRPVNVYGVGMKGNLMTLLKLIKRGVLPPLPTFEHSFSLIGVEDLCQGIVRAARLPAAVAGAPGQINPPVYLLSDACEYHIKTVENAMRQALGKAQPGWSTPRPVFFAGALLLEIASRLLPVNNAPGLRSYRALSRSYSVDSAASWQRLGYNPRATFFTRLPLIVSSLTPNTDS